MECAVNVPSHRPPQHWIKNFLGYCHTCICTPSSRSVDEAGDTLSHGGLRVPEDDNIVPIAPASALKEWGRASFWSAPVCPMGRRAEWLQVIIPPQHSLIELYCNSALRSRPQHTVVCMFGPGHNYRLSNGRYCKVALIIASTCYRGQKLYGAFKVSNADKEVDCGSHGYKIITNQ